MQKKLAPSLDAKLSMSLDDLAEKSDKPHRGKFSKFHSRPKFAHKDRTETFWHNMKLGAFKETGNEKKKVYVENLNFKTEWKELKDHMKSVGTVEHADIFTRKSGASKGCGYFF